MRIGAGTVNAVSFVLAGCFLLLPSEAVGSQSVQKSRDLIAAASIAKDFSVADSIEMVLPQDLGPGGYTPNPEYASISPDGKHVMFLLRHGNLGTSRNEYKLQIVESREIETYINGDYATRVPVAHTIINIANDDYADRAGGYPRLSVRNVKWYGGGSHVAFIAADQGDRGDVYVYSVRDQSLTRATWSRGAVLDYDLSLASSTVVYWAYSDAVGACGPAFPEPEQLGGRPFYDQVVGCRSPDDERGAPLRAYRAIVGEERSGVAVSPAFLEGPVAPRLTISPDGRWATMLGTVTHPVPARWKGFFRAESDEFDFWHRNISANEDTVGLVGLGAAPLARFYLIDLTEGTAEPIMDSPTAYLGLNVASHWLSDSESVILTHVYLPGSGTNDGVNKLHLVEFDVKTKQYRSLLSFKDGIVHPGHGEVYAKTSLINDDLVSIVVNSNSGTKFSGTVEADEHRIVLLGREGPRWKAVRRPGFVQQANEGLRIELRQSLNAPPDFFARDLSSGKEGKITDLNPQLAKIEVPEIQLFSWSTESGEQWRGGLVLPPSLQEGSRLPLVIQAHCFEEKFFIVDSSHPNETAPFAARALAGSGFAVLQLDIGGPSHGHLAESEAADHFVAAIESAISILHHRGVVDQDNVGLVGWSASGRYILSALTKSKVQFRAAVIADSGSVGPATYSLAAGAPHNIASFVEDFVGGAPWGEGLSEWIKNQPFYGLDRVSAALRLEVNGRQAIHHWYDIFTGMRRLGKPVEYFIYDGAAHQPQNPLQRLISSQGMIDWMSFWLLNKERDEAGQAEQYKRWRAMRVPSRESNNLAD